MQKRISFLALAAALTMVASAAQAPRDSEPSSINAPGADYPRVSADGRITFRVKAPNAERVEIDPLVGNVRDGGYNGLGKQPYTMTKDQDGYWTVTTPPVIPGLHYYTVLIDGASVVDPSSAETYFGSTREVSGVEVPEPGVDFYLPKDVPHGEIRIFWYDSKVTDQWERVYVYLPPGYDTHPQQRYPLLYLHHGGGEDQADWVNQGHVNFILDNLIAAGKAKPMILVMGSGYGYGGPRISMANASPAARAREMNRVVTMAVDELIPEIDSHFRTIPDRDHRAIAGFSMGADQSLAIGMNHLDMYSAIGVFSRPVSPNFDVKTAFNGVMADPGAFNKRLHLLWFGAGTAETGIFNSIKETRAALDAAGIKSAFDEYPGLAHEWLNWRKQVNDFAPLLFRW